MKALPLEMDSRCIAGNCIFYCGNVAVTKGAVYESQNDRTFADTTGTKHSYSVIIALFWHIIHQKTESAID
ncbi:hypothetical protein TPS_08544 [Trichinella pseudospiralis]